MSSKGVLILGSDRNIEAKAHNLRLGVSTSKEYSVVYDKTLIVEPGIRVPWDLLPAALHFLNKWDAAVPLWRYMVTAEDIGTSEERKMTKEVIRDLRVLLYSHELLFVRKSEAGEALVSTWVEEMKLGKEKRLAFLRALYKVKPKCCVLPISWLAEVREYSKQSFMHSSIRGVNAGKPLVKVEVSPGRFVKCHEGDEEKVLEQFQRQRR